MSREDLRAAPLVMDTRFNDNAEFVAAFSRTPIATPIPQPEHDPHNFRRVVTIGLTATTALLAIATVILVGIIRGWL